MNLFQNPAHAGSVGANHDEQVLAEEPGVRIRVYDFHVSEILSIGADFILALYDEYAVVPQYPMRFAAPFLVKLNDGRVPFSAAAPG